MKKFSEKTFLIIGSLILAYLYIYSSFSLQGGTPLRIMKKNGQYLSVYTGVNHSKGNGFTYPTYKLSDKPSLVKGIMHHAKSGTIHYKTEQANGLNNNEDYLYLQLVSNDKNLMHKITSLKGWGLTEVPFQLKGYYLTKVEDQSASFKFDVSSSIGELFYPTELIVSGKRIDLVEVK